MKTILVYGIFPSQKYDTSFLTGTIETYQWHQDYVSSPEDIIISHSLGCMKAVKKTAKIIFLLDPCHIIPKLPMRAKDNQPVVCYYSKWLLTSDVLGSYVSKYKTDISHPQQPSRIKEII